MAMNDKTLKIITIVATLITCTVGASIIYDRNQSNVKTITIFADTCKDAEVGYNCDGTIE